MRYLPRGKWQRRHRGNPDSRLVRYLASGQGFAAVVAADQDIANEAVLRSARDCSNVRVVSVSARDHGFDRLASLLEGGKFPHSTGETDPILVALAAARSEPCPLVIVAGDADLASPRSLERLRIAGESFADDSVPVRLVLCGGSFLLNLLELPRLRGLSTRVTLQIRLKS